MKKTIIFFKKIRKQRFQKTTQTVEQFDPNFHADSRVDSFGRVVHGHPVSNTHFIRTVTDRHEALKSLDKFSGVYSSVLDCDPADIVEYAYDNGIDL